MGEITQVDLVRLAGLVDHVDDAADRVAAIAWPRLEPAALPGSAVSGVATSQSLEPHVEQLSSALHGWAVAARAAADAFVQADTANGERFDRR
ncbi:hypothetical protein [Mycobacterium sp. SMC-4]|uniref:DUF7162 family protein n=1 Tax=Mycobacterium sp. SMC-4 TaxID=2857059 RepID=UPI0021B4CE81|nr:hypothetical protein [Mycobacterium sp. SMC-4]UXA16156.1 hypothetical protein KXD98_15010 [Mycobacterium sp. SMC-4]